MKKITIILLSFLILNVYNSYAQSGWISSGANTYTQPIGNNVGIGTITPGAVLDVYGSSNPNFTVRNGLTTLEIGISSCQGCYNTFANISSAVIRPLGGSIYTKNIIFSTGTLASYGGNFLFASDSDKLMQINDNKTITMGNITTPAGYFLYVEKGILTEKLKIALKSDAVNWSDFVFDKNYKLMSLNEVERFVKKNKHLPEIPSAKEMYSNGLDVAQMDAKLLQKIEELTLYMIEMKKENEILKKDVKELKNK